MSESILTSVKNTLDVHSSETAFDSRIVMFINSTFVVLEQLGADHKPGFAIEDDSAVWSDYIGNEKHLNLVKTLMCLRVRQLFDPQTSSFLLKAAEDQIAQHDWRLHVLVDNDPLILGPVLDED